MMLSDEEIIDRYEYIRQFLFPHHIFNNSYEESIKCATILGVYESITPAKYFEEREKFLENLRKILIAEKIDIFYVEDNGWEINERQP